MMMMTIGYRLEMDPVARSRGGDCYCFYNRPLLPRQPLAQLGLAAMGVIKIV
jgi:hypothetical protein